MIDSSVNMKGSFEREDKKYTWKYDLINTFNVRQNRRHNKLTCRWTMKDDFFGFTEINFYLMGCRPGLDLRRLVFERNWTVLCNQKCGIIWYLIILLSGDWGHRSPAYIKYSTGTDSRTTDNTRLMVSVVSANRHYLKRNNTHTHTHV